MQIMGGKHGIVPNFSSWSRQPTLRKPYFTYLGKALHRISDFGAAGLDSAAAR
jgi:hypothetical protein